MENKNTKEQVVSASKFFDEIWEQGWTFIRTIVDVVKDPVLILDKNLSVIAANESFYRLFQVDKRETEGALVYRLGNGQWDIPNLRQLLESILPQNTFFKSFQVTHEFPHIGRKTFILNARPVHYQIKPSKQSSPPIIMLSMEDITEIMAIAESFACHTSSIEARFSKRTDKLEQLLNKAKKDLVAI